MFEGKWKKSLVTKNFPKGTEELMPATFICEVLGLSLGWVTDHPT
jgi:hypothetical protein